MSGALKVSRFVSVKQHFFLSFVADLTEYHRLDFWGLQVLQSGKGNKKALTSDKSRITHGRR